MGRSEDFKKLPRFDEAPESLRRAEIPPPPRVPSLSPPEVGYRVAPPPMRGARPDTAPPPAHKKSTPPPPPPARRHPSAPPPPAALSRSAPPPPALRTHPAAPEQQPVERIDLRAVLREPAAPPEETFDVSDVIVEFEVDQEAATRLHRIPKRNQDQPSIAPVSMSSDELVEVTHLARNNRLARVGYAAVFGATIVAGLYIWRMQPPAVAQPALAAAVPQPFPTQEPVRVMAANAQPVVEQAAQPAMIPAVAAEKASARAAGSDQTASSSKRHSQKTSKGETVSSDEATAEEAPAAAPAGEPTQAAAPATAEQAAAPATAEQAAAPATAEQAPESPPFNQAAAHAALDAAAGRAAGCLKPGDPEGLARVVVTFAPSGRVTTAAVDGPPFAGTPTGGCIARAFRSAEVPPFSGKLMTVGKTVTLR